MIRRLLPFSCTFITKTLLFKLPHTSSLYTYSSITFKNLSVSNRLTSSFISTENNENIKINWKVTDNDIDQGNNLMISDNLDYKKNPEMKRVLQFLYYKGIIYIIFFIYLRYLF